ncbi:MAG: hypothetical protein J4432_02290 [DPANN group archaeon]|nr:hypothetical protein [DPANN group archaeon]
MWNGNKQQFTEAKRVAEDVRGALQDQVQRTHLEILWGNPVDTAAYREVGELLNKLDGI